VSRIGDLASDPTNARWSASKKQDKIQEAQERFVLDTRALTDNTTDTAVADQQEYPLPADCLDIKRLAHKGVLLTRKSKFDLDIAIWADWSQTKGTPHYYYVDLDSNNKKYGLYPVPQGGDAGANLALEYVKIPPVMTSDSDVPFDSHTLLTPYHMAIAYWAAADLLRQDPSQANALKIAEYEKQYEKLVSDCIETFKDLAETRPMRMGGGRYFRGY
jgi:hypothetical protein